MADFQYDPEQPRPQPQREALVKAHEMMMRDEEQIERYLRQQWETTMSAVKVALDAWRRIFPVEAAQHSMLDEAERWQVVAHSLERAYLELDRLSLSFQGPVMTGVQSLALTLDDLNAVPDAR